MPVSAGNSNAAGSVSVQFTIPASGVVTIAQGSGMSSALAQCVAIAVKAIQFPKRKLPVTMSFPFTFKPG